jgi:hypothetical protein
VRGDQAEQYPTKVSDVGRSYSHFCGCERGCRYRYLNTCKFRCSLNDNELCGINKYGKGEYTTEGMTTLFGGITRCTGLVSLSLNNNRIGAYYCGGGEWVTTPDGARAIATALPHCRNLQALRCTDPPSKRARWRAMAHPCCCSLNTDALLSQFEHQRSLRSVPT